MHIRTQDYYIGDCGCPQLNNNNNGSGIKNILTNDSCMNNKILAKIRKEMNDRKPKLLNARQTLNEHYQSLMEKYNNKYNNHINNNNNNNNNNKNTKRKYEKIQEGAKNNSKNYSKDLNSNVLILQQKQQKHKYNEFIQQQNQYNHYKSNNNTNNNGSKSSNQNILDNRTRERRSSTSTVDSDLELF